MRRKKSYRVFAVWSDSLAHARNIMKDRSVIYKQSQFIIFVAFVKAKYFFKMRGNFAGVSFRTFYCRVCVVSDVMMRKYVPCRVCRSWKIDDLQTILWIVRSKLNEFLFNKIREYSPNYAVCLFSLSLEKTKVNEQKMTGIMPHHHEIIFNYREAYAVVQFLRNARVSRVLPENVCVVISIRVEMTIAFLSFIIITTILFQCLIVHSSKEREVVRLFLCTVYGTLNVVNTMWVDPVYRRFNA